MKRKQKKEMLSAKAWVVKNKYGLFINTVDWEPQSARKKFVDQIGDGWTIEVVPVVITELKRGRRKK